MGLVGRWRCEGEQKSGAENARESARGSEERLRTTVWLWEAAESVQRQWIMRRNNVKITLEGKHL